MGLIRAWGGICLAQHLDNNPLGWDGTRCEIICDTLQFRKPKLHFSYQSHFSDDPGLFSAGSFQFSISGPGIRSSGLMGPILALALWE